MSSRFFVFGMTGYGYEIMQGDQGVLNIILFVTFLLVFVFAVHPILTENTE